MEGIIFGHYGYIGQMVNTTTPYREPVENYRVICPLRPSICRTEEVKKK